MKKLILLCFVASFAQAKEDRDDDREAEDNIEHVDDIGELQTMINSNKYLLAYFFHPNCMPCMEYVPFFDQIPQAMEGLDWAEEVEFVKVNMAGNEKTIPELYGVRGYPWINLYKDGKAIRWKGRRNNKKLIRFIYRRIMQSYRKIETVDMAVSMKTNFNEDTSVMAIAYFPEGSEKFDLIKNVSDDYDLITFVWTDDAEIASKFEIKTHGVFVVKRMLPDRLTKHAGPVSDESLIYFLDHYGTPLVTEYSEETTMIVFDKKQKMHVYLFMPDAKDDKETTKLNNIMQEFLALAAKTEDAGYGQETLFIMVDTDNPDNFKVSTMFEILDDAPPTYRITNTETHNKFGRQIMNKKEWKAERMSEVLENARSQDDKFMVSEGAPGDFYEREIMFLTTSVIEQNIQVGKPLLILFYDERNVEELQLLEEISAQFPLETYKKKKRGYPRIAQYNIKRNVILINSWSQVLRGMKPKAGDFFLIRNLDKMVKYEGEKSFEPFKDWIKQKSKVGHDEL